MKQSFSIFIRFVYCNTNSICHMPVYSKAPQRCREPLLLPPISDPPMYKILNYYRLGLKLYCSTTDMHNPLLGLKLGCS